MKRFRVRMIWEFEQEFEDDFDEGSVDFHYNRSGWCADNALDALNDISEERGCICQVVSFECLGEIKEPTLMTGEDWESIALSDPI